MIERTETIKLRVEYDNVDRLILQALKYADLTVSQLQAIISFHIKEDISPMVIYKKLDYLVVINKVKKRKKNSHVFIYYIP